MKQLFPRSVHFNHHKEYIIVVLLMMMKMMKKMISMCLMISSSAHSPLQGGSHGWPSQYSAAHFILIIIVIINIIRITIVVF